MISFKPLTEDSLDSLTEMISAHEGAQSDEVAEMLEALCALNEEDVEVSVCSAYGCLLARIFDMGRYSFIYPVALYDGAGADDAVDAVRAYAVKEEIGLVFTDVPVEEITVLCGIFTHMRVDREDCFGESLRVSVESESRSVSRVYGTDTEGLFLDSINEADGEKMARLNRDGGAKEFWGYDYLSDIGEVCDSFFYETACAEIARGTAVSLALRLDGEYIGEALVYAFDFKGGAEVAIRLLPEYRGKGYGGKGMGMLINHCRNAGLSRIYARVNEKNTPSVRMMDGLLNRDKVEDGVIYYKSNFED